MELMKSARKDVAQKYIAYRNQRNIARKAKTRDVFMSIVNAKNNDITRENANMNADTPAGMMMKFASETTKPFVDDYLLSEESRDAVTHNYLHIHDKDFSLITFNCCQIDLLKLFHGGFSTGHGFLREPNSIRAYASLACIAIQSNQNDQHGGQSIVNFDYAMAEGVAKTFAKLYARKLHEAIEDVLCTEDETPLVEKAIAAAGHKPQLQRDAADYDANLERKIGTARELESTRRVTNEQALKET